MVNYSSWLGELPDDKFISSLSIPGTHNSAACHTALPSVQCQDASISKQLEHGVRFLDIRTSKNILKNDERDQKNLVVIHGKFPVKLIGNVRLHEVLSEVYKFLETHPSEFVIVSIKQEGNGKWDNENDEYGNLLWDHYISPEKHRWHLNTNISRIGECRGKAVLFRRFGVKNEERKNEFGIDAAWWSYNCVHDDRGPLQIQDWCELSSAQDICKKAEYIKSLSQKAISHNETSAEQDPKLFVNFCSGSNFFDPNCWPSRICSELKQNNIQEAFGKGNGITILDYAESDNWRLTRNLIDLNF